MNKEAIEELRNKILAKSCISISYKNGYLQAIDDYLALLQECKTCGGSKKKDVITITGKSGERPCPDCKEPADSQLVEFENKELKTLLKSDYYKLRSESRLNDLIKANNQISKLQARIKELEKHRNE